MRILFLIFLFISTLHAGEEATKHVSFPSSSLASTSGLVPTIVNGSVCVVTGEYIDHEVDFYVPGLEPLVWERMYSSENFSTSYLYDGWQLNHPTSLMLKKIERGSVYGGKKILGFDAIVGESSGSNLLYNKKSDHSYGTYQFKNRKGFTNTCGGEIGARTNLKNQNVELIPDSDKKRADRARITGPSSDVRYFEKYGKIENDKNILFQMTKHKKINGCSIFYEYKKDYVTKISVKDCLEREYAHLDIENKRYKDFKDEPIFKVNSSSGQSVTYHFETYKEKKEGIRRFYLSKVECAHKPTLSYFYEPKKDDKYRQLIRKEYANDKHFLENEYYKKGHNHFAGLDIKISDKDDPRIDRVRAQYAPGNSGEKVLTHQYHYHVHLDGEHNLIFGVTDVFDAHNQRTAYHYDNNQRLTRIEKANAVDKFIWSTSDPQDGNLLAKLLTYPNDTVHSGRSFDYDGQGNIVAEHFFGKLSGLVTSAPHISAEGKILNACESYNKSYTYTPDNRHLLSTESEDNGCTIQYVYMGATDLIEAQYLFYQGAIKMRQFFKYDAANLMTETIIDDGSQYHRDNLQNVTERKITRFNRLVTGLPERIEEWVYNKGKEDLLHIVKCHYTAQGWLTRQEHCEPSGHILYALEWEYDPHGNVTKEANAVGYAIYRQYDLNDNLIYETGLLPQGYAKGSFDAPVQPSKRFTYDFRDRLTVEELFQDNQVLVTRHQYDLLNNRIATTDYFGNTTRLAYDEKNRLITTTLPAERSPTITQEYDIADNVTKLTDPRGNVTETTYNARGKPISITHPGGATESFTYHLDGTPWKTVAPNGMITEQEHDFLGRVTSETRYGENAQRICQKTAAYNTFHMMTSTDEQGVVTNYEYDSRGRLIKTVSGDHITTYTYDNQNRTETVTKAISSTEYVMQRYRYDLLDRVTDEILQDQNQIVTWTSYEYDERNNRTKVINRDADGNCISITQTQYNHFNQPTLIVDALGNQTHIDYVITNALKIITTDPIGNKKIATHDTLGRVVKIEQQNLFGEETALQTCSYDAAGNKIQEIHTCLPSRSEYILAWEYNAANQITKQVEAVGTPLQKVTQYAYNKAGQKILHTKPDGVQLQFQYDIQGRLQFYSGPDFHYEYRYNQHHQPIYVEDHFLATNTIRTYDDYNNLLSETLGNGFTSHYQYDPLNRLIQITLPDQSQVHYQYRGARLYQVQREVNGDTIYTHTYTKYDLLNSPIESVLINGVTLKRSYDPLHRPLKLTCTAFTEEQFEYDSVSNMKSVVTQDNVSPYTRNFAYDDLYHLKSENDHTYTYDSLHNRTQKDNQEYALNALNQVTQQTNSEYIYDLNGNLIQKNENGEITTLHYDSLDRLVVVEQGLNRIIYEYDAFNRRIHKNYNNLTWDFIYQEQNEIGAMRDGRFPELRVLGIGVGAEIGAAIAIEVWGETYAPVHDHNGNVVALLDMAGNTFESYRYSAFGEQKIYDSRGQAQNATLTPWRYASKRFDYETGFLYFGRRYYDPTLGRWATCDPIGFKDGPNLYAYLNNNPMMRFDLYGLHAIDAYKDSVFAARNAHTYKLRDKPDAEDKFHRHLHLPYQISCALESTFNKIGSWISFPTPNQSFVETLGRPKIPGKTTAFFNGAGMNLERVRQVARYISDKSGGYDVTIIHKATHSVPLDLLECTMWLKHINSEPINLLTNFLHETFEKNPNERICIIAYSQGAIGARNGFIEYYKFDPSKAKQIDSVNFCPGAYVLKGTCNRAIHYCANPWRDIVPYFDILGRFRENDRVVVLPSHPNAPYNEHDIMSPTYEKPLIYELERFKR